MPRLALTIGDPLGIGPEITAKSLVRLDSLPDDCAFDVIGSLDALMKAASDIGVTLPQGSRIAYHDITGEKPGDIAYRAIEHAVRQVRDGAAQAIVTGPISKKHLYEAGHAFPGHTEILEHLAHTMSDAQDARAEMLFVYKKFRLLLLTRHIALKDVPEALAKSGAVARPLKILIQFLRHQCGIDMPRIALLGPNPHAGEIAGDEEKRLFMPVIHAVNAIGASQLEGCFAADAFFRDFDAGTTGYDAIVAPYHDQGLIPFKMVAGYEAVNVTIGLPFLRTSVGHGTAEDIAGKGVAREDSLMAAIKEALGLIGKNQATA
ncbi:MAG: 4-hydroxythreonine-4-phosphate dehydrogenase PdxA [Alphaproteobacteria bacterium]|nr:4-hydroxythreonine-4-phosphate dehydrogenase PdxA [Alphaproteobacteria bacterium]